jgi:hypothetical protein
MENAMVKLRPIYTLLLLCTVSACTRDIPFAPDNGFEPRPVVFGFLCPDSPVSVQIWKTQSITAPEATAPVANAVVNWFTEGFFTDVLLGKGGGRYASVLNAPSAGKRGELVVLNSDFNFRRSFRMPDALQLAETDTFTSLFPPGGALFTFRFRITDPDSTADFYRLYIQHTFYAYRDSAGQRDSTLRTEKVDIRAFDPTDFAVASNPANRLNRKEILFPDTEFNGGTYRSAVGTFRIPQAGKTYRTSSMSLVVERCEEALYRYYNTRMLHLAQQGNPAGQPGAVSSNIPGGFGVIGAYTQATKVYRWP